MVEGEFRSMQIGRFRVGLKRHLVQLDEPRWQSRSLEQAWLHTAGTPAVVVGAAVVALVVVGAAVVGAAVVGAAVV